MGMTQRLRFSDYRFIGICLALLAASTWFSVRYFYLAFPEASIDFRVGRGDGQKIAEQFLAGRGYSLAGYRDAASFTFDDDAKTFLEREAGLEQASRIMGSRVRLWRWSYRWFRPLQKEEYRADITPRGELAGFTHQIRENAPRPALSGDEARAAAERFLRDTLHRDPATLDFEEVSTVDRPARVDRVFTWKEHDFNLHEATNRVEVTLLGNEIGGYREYLKIPEQWTRDYARLRSKNDAAQYGDAAALLGLAAGMVVVIVLRVRRHDIRWRRAAWVGVIGMVLSLCASANQFPLQEFGYPTTDSYSSFLTQQALQSVLNALGYGGLLFVIAAAAEPLYRELLPGRVSLGNLFGARGLRTRSFLLGSILGVSLCAIFIAYQTAFYMVAYRFGAWSPADVPYSDLLNTRFPWAFVLFGGFFPAVSEEFMFRMFAIPFLRKVTRFLPAAVVLAGFIWGFGHAGYPQQPFYIRGVEVGIGGVALGLIMLRWGILPTLVWHYSVDAMYSAMLLLRSPSLYFKLSGAASAGIMLLPVAIALVAYWRRGGFQPEAGLTNGDEIPAIEPEPAPVMPMPTGGLIEYKLLASRWRLLAAGVGAAGLLFALVPLTRFGTTPNYRLSTNEARANADAFVRSLGMDPGGFHQVAYPAVHWGGADSLAGKYFLEREGTGAAAELFQQNRPIRHWATRYFRPLDQEEMLVSVHPESGHVLGFAHTLPEDRPGADLDPDSARRIAEQFASSHGVRLDSMQLKESSSEKKKARRDYTLVWEAPQGDPRNLDQARFREEIEVDGDRVAEWRSYWKIPESYERARARQNALSIALLTLRIAMLAAAVVWGILLLVQKIRQGLVPWRNVIQLAAPAAVLAAAASLLSLPQLLRDYNTAIPLGTFEAVAYTSIGMSALAGFLLLAGAVAFFGSFYPESLAAFRARSGRPMALDAALTIWAGAGLAVFLDQSGTWLMDRFHGSALYAIDAPSGIVSAAPVLTALAGAFRSTLLFAAALALLAVLAQRIPKPWMRIALGLAALTVLLPGGIRTPGELALSYGIALLSGGAVLLFCWGFARANYLAYGLALWLLALRPAMAALLGTGNPTLRVQGFAVAAVMAVTVLWALWPGRRKRFSKGIELSAADR